MSYKDLSFDRVSPKLNVIIGPNNSGKTNLFRILRLAKDTIENSRPLGVVNLHDLLNSSEERGDFRVSVEVELDQNEIEALRDFLDLSIRVYTRTEIRSMIAMGNRRDLSKILDQVDPEQRLELGNKYVNFVSACSKDFADFFTEMLDSGNLVMEYDGNALKTSYRFQFGNHHEAYIELGGSSIVSAPVQGYMSIQEQLLGRLGEAMEKNGASKRDLFESDQKQFDEKMRQMVDIKSFTLEALKKYNCGPFLVEVSKLQGAEFGELTKIFSVISERPESNLHYDLSWLLFRIISHSLIFTDEFRSRPTGELKPESHGLRGDKILEVRDLAAQLRIFKNGGQSEQRKYEVIEATFKQIYPELTFKTEDRLSGGNIGKEQSMFAEVVIEDSIRKTRVPIISTGSGILETLYLLVYLMEFSGKVLLLDEPSAHIHPTKQKRLSELIERSSSDNQIFLITHSPYMINSSNLENTVAFRLENHETQVHRPVFSYKAEREKTIRWFELDPKIPAALFSNKVILVDGEEEERALPIWFTKAGTDLGASNVALFNTHSDNNFLTYRKILNDWGVPVFVVCDKKAVPKLQELRKEEVYQMQEDDFGGYLEKNYNSMYSEARKLFGSSKAIIAAYVAYKEDPPQEIKAMLAGDLLTFLSK